MRHPTPSAAPSAPSTASSSSPVTSPVVRLAVALRRMLAALVLAGLLVATPVLAVRLLGAGGWSWSGIRRAWASGHLDDQALTQIGVALFVLLWCWFTATVVVEVATVLRWRRQGRVHGLPAVVPAPTAWVRHLVRAAVISSTTALGVAVSSIGVATTGPVHAAPIVAPHVAPHAATDAAWDGSGVLLRPQRHDPHSWTATPDEWRAPGADVVTAGRRDTPYSIAARLGDTAHRDRIIELNKGALGPDGTPWSGGVFPAGMEVQVPAQPGRAWTSYTVEPGDSIYGIADDLVELHAEGADGAELRAVASDIIDHNLGRTMVDGDTFDDPSFIRAGWVIEVPADRFATDESSAAALPDEVHVVVAGESYWQIADDQLRADGPVDPSAAVVAEVTAALRDLNAPRLGHDDPDLLLPGEIVHLTADPVAAAPVAAAPVDLEPVVAATPLDREPITADVVPSAASPERAAPPATPTVPPTATPPTAPDATAPEAPAPAPASTPAAPASAPGPTGEITDSGGLGHLDSGDEQSPLGWSIGATLLLSAGALGVLEARRREQLRRAGARAIPVVPSPSDVALERTLRSLDAPGRAARIDIALRAAATRLVPLGRHVLALMLRDDGQLVLALDAPAEPSAPWCAAVEADRWLLPASTPAHALADEARRSGGPCPALVHLGRTVGGTSADHDLFVDLEAIGLLCLTGAPHQNRPLLQAIIGTLVLSPLAETVRTVVAGAAGVQPDVEIAVPTLPEHMNAEVAESLDAALDVAAMHLGSTMTVTGTRRTFALRASGSDGRGEMWEPVIVVAAGAPDEHPSDDRDAAELAGCGGRGLGVVIDHLVPGARWRTGPQPRPGESTRGTTTWLLEPLGERFTPVGLDAERLAQVCGLLERAERPLDDEAEDDVDRPGSRGIDATITASTHAAGPFVAPTYDVMVRLLGGVEVCGPTGEAVPFSRSKSLELIAWLVTHRDRSTRTAARTALWELDVRAPTFANVVSEARRGMARAVPPPEGEEWIERTLTEELPLHHGVRTDVDLLTARVEAARGRPDAEAIEILRPGVALIRDLPFAGTNFLWPDAEGITSACTLLATGASIELSYRYLALGDVDGVFWASGQGLRVLPGHEELIGLRMRAHASRGDLAGVRGEWEVYERALHADPWSTSEPSPKLVAVRRELLAT